MMKTEDILGLCSFFLPFLGKKKKKASSGDGLDRFKDYPDSTGNYGGGYYDKQVQEELAEKSAKEDELYRGDKSYNSVYDPFYKLSEQENNILLMRDSEDLTDIEERGLVLRARIVPNSLFCANYDKERPVNYPLNGKAQRQEHVYACVVELFNPFPSSTGSKGKITITSISYKISAAGKELDDLGITANDNLNLHYLSTPEVASDSQIVERINNGIFNFFKRFSNPQLSAYENLPTSIPPQTSIYLPVFLSYLPDVNGNITRSVMPLPMGSGIDFTKYTYPIRSLSLTLRIGVRQGSTDGRLHVCKIASNASKNSYKWTETKSESVSMQRLEYFRPWATPIYSRPEFWNALFLQKQIDLSSSTGGRAARSYWWSYKYLTEVEKYANPFGPIILSNI